MKVPHLKVLLTMENASLKACNNIFSFSGVTSLDTENGAKGVSPKQNNDHTQAMLETPFTVAKVWKFLKSKVSIIGMPDLVKSSSRNYDGAKSQKVTGQDE